MWRRVATAVVFAALAASAHAAGGGPIQGPQPKPGSALELTATAYCHQGTTKSGTRTHTGIVAADPLVLPVGSVLRIDGLGPGFAGIYTVMDTGQAVKGEEIDIFMPDCGKADQFGRKPAHVRVLRRGWNPKASAKR